MRGSAGCADCGTAQSVTAVERQVQFNGVQVGTTTIGISTVSCVIIGDLLGYQICNGKTLATLVGVTGGACAGNTAEKNMKRVTVYDVQVRMDDNAMRKLDISTSCTVSSKVIVETKNMRP